MLDEERRAAERTRIANAITEMAVLFIGAGVVAVLYVIWLATKVISFYHWPAIAIVIIFIAMGALATIKLADALLSLNRRSH